MLCTTRRALFPHRKFQKWPNPAAFLTMTLKCASHHNGIHFSDIPTARSAPRPSMLLTFNTFDFKMCFAPWLAIFDVSSHQRMAPHASALASRLFDTLEPMGNTCANTDGISQLSYLFSRVHFVSFDFLLSDLLSSDFLLFELLSSVALPILAFHRSILRKFKNMILMNINGKSTRRKNRKDRSKNKRKKNIFCNISATFPPSQSWDWTVRPNIMAHA